MWQQGPPHRTSPFLLPCAPNGASSAGPVGTTYPGSTFSVLHPFLPPSLCSSPSPAGAPTVRTRPLDAGPLTQAEEGKEKDWVRDKTTTTSAVLFIVHIIVVKSAQSKGIHCTFMTSGTRGKVESGKYCTKAYSNWNLL